jgi:hypothetical protein
VKSPTPPIINRSAGVVTPMTPNAAILARLWLWRDKGRSVRWLMNTSLSFPSVLSPCGGDGLPPHVGNCVGAATGEGITVSLR